MSGFRLIKKRGNKLRNIYTKYGLHKIKSAKVGITKDQALKKGLIDKNFKKKELKRKNGK